VTKRQMVEYLEQSPNPQVAALAEPLRAMIDEIEQRVGGPAEVLVKVNKCRQHFVLMLNGQPFACCDEPCKVLAWDGVPEGDYEVVSCCTCGSAPLPFGRLSMYGDGIGVLHGPKGHTWVREG
jgi:hypothetical protein